ncbi:MAG: hypothetical protein LBJ61_09375 [Deltaproteobacteria bacterium]|jgi:hypothetical protein|nr:hypothetical protein [Deltaproteobacteria bacterium]
MDSDNGWDLEGGGCPDLNHYEIVARIMANELSTLELASEPLDVAETIETLSEEMNQMPQIISDCRMAVEVFNELDVTLDRMYSLADRASESNEADEALRVGLDEEFSGYSHIVARMAGADDFDGPSLSLRTRGDALVARKILGCLSQARHDFSKRVFDQRRRIDGTMTEAIELLSRLLREVENITYQTRDGLTELVAHLQSLSGEYEEYNLASLQKPIYVN